MPSIRKMNLDVLLFASYADALGAPRVTVEVGADPTVRDVLDGIRRLPGASRLPATPLVAVNHRFARAHERVRAGDEVAIIPPVAGG